MKMKILVVDDELLLRDVLYNFLDRLGYDVDVAPDAEKALEIAKVNKPDIALVDIKLPKASGIELTQQLKNMYKDLPIIIMTGYPSLDTAINAMENGANEYIVKPFRLDELTRTINKYLPEINSD
ncbi:MAG: response regulator [Candidatus Cloacimonadales bacterium]|jgi:DNA-binding response OmpR family regulator|nr:response regulator [Candidatus Cloacimonadota bacterium]MDD2649721.1 response regulator [Candidatus Cloacimonadota bacterium]MDD3500799.1 response regulator [Candidatus Cloacimonadota bacterium]MDX9977298.1 response regulator [Candidatus Cloacimonadales bacterium]